jgi:hypothetical protein
MGIRREAFGLQGWRALSPACVELRDTPTHEVLLLPPFSNGA